MTRRSTTGSSSYELPPLDEQIATMQNRYLRPVVKTPRRSLPADQNRDTGETTVLGIDDSGGF